jgi:hypothetical protein
MEAQIKYSIDKAKIQDAIEVLELQTCVPVFFFNERLLISRRTATESLNRILLVRPRELQ